MANRFYYSLSYRWWFTSFVNETWCSARVASWHQESSNKLQSRAIICYEAGVEFTTALGHRLLWMLSSDLIVLCNSHFFREIRGHAVFSSVSLLWIRDMKQIFRLQKLHVEITSKHMMKLSFNTIIFGHIRSWRAEEAHSKNSQLSSGNCKFVNSCGLWSSMLLHW